MSNKIPVRKVVDTGVSVVYLYDSGDGVLRPAKATASIYDDGAALITLADGTTITRAPGKYMCLLDYLSLRTAVVGDGRSV